MLLTADDDLQTKKNLNAQLPLQIHLKLLLAVQYSSEPPPSADDGVLRGVCPAFGTLLGEIHAAEQLAGFPGCASDMELRR